jgi:hypothetical protein
VSEWSDNFVVRIVCLNGVSSTKTSNSIIKLKNIRFVVIHFKVKL